MSSLSHLPKPKNFVLAGISGSGKSTVGRHLSVLLGFGFLDLDSLIESLARKKVTEIFLQEGEDAFRNYERQALETASQVKSHVVALGGGALQDPNCLRIAKSIGPLIWLKPSADEIARRLYMKVTELEKRPLFKEMIMIENKDERREAIKRKILSLTDSRSENYQNADIILDGGFVTPETSACQLKDILHSMDLLGPRENSFGIVKPIENG
ncbi:MAG: shikimate kinase [Proteobacteria bacterium]|nr:shikimate kinase [Pseudomonadota bacterium]